MSTLRVIMKQRLFGQEVRNVFYVAGAFADVANGQAIVDYFREAWTVGTVSLEDRLHSSWELYEAEIKDVTDPANPVIPFEFTAGTLVGLQTAERLPTQIAMLLQFKSITAPPNRSRKYLAGWTESDFNGIDWNTNPLDAATNFATHLLDMATNLDPGIALTVTRIDRVTGVLIGSNILSQHSIVDYPRTQRRRTPGRGI